MTPSYNPLDASHRAIRLDIELGNGISNMVSIADAHTAMAAAGFELLHAEDLADREDETPWYYPIAGDLRYLGSFGDLFRILRMTRPAREMMRLSLGALTVCGLAPGGSARTAEGLAKGADALVLGAKKGLFTPMYLMIAKKAN